MKEFIAKLEKHGYEVDFLCEDVYRIRGHGIIASFVEEYYIPHWYNYPRILIADNEKAFNKWTDCPLYMPLNDALADPDALLKHLEWLNTDEGYNYSTNFEWLDGPLKLPHCQTATRPQGDN